MNKTKVNHELKIWKLNKTLWRDLMEGTILKYLLEKKLTNALLILRFGYTRADF